MFPVFDLRVAKNYCNGAVADNGSPESRPSTIGIGVEGREEATAPPPRNESKGPSWYSV